MISSRVVVLFFSFIFYLCIRFNHNGEMQEWLNWLAWKASISQKGIGGSNPPFSAEKSNPKGSLFCFERGRGMRTQGSPTTESLARARIPLSPRKEQSERVALLF